MYVNASNKDFKPTTASYIRVLQLTYAYCLLLPFPPSPKSNRYALFCMEPLQYSSSFTVFLLLLFLALSLFLEPFSMVNCKALEQCLQKESSALLQLKRGFITGELDTWQPGTACSSRVEIGAGPGPRPKQSIHRRLTNLSILNLSGALYIEKVPVGISRLTKLTSLDLSGNGYPLTANPIILQNMSNLRVLNLDYVNLSTYGVEWCGALTNYTPALAVLRMIDSSLSGYFPNEIFFLRNLKELDLSNNQMLSGSLSDFPEYSNLETLYLYGTNFSGNLPDTIGNLKFLTDLNLGECQFSGKIPTSMGNLSRLKWLYLSDNNFSGANTCLNGNLCNLKELDLSDNSFSGPISASVFTLPALEKLQLQQNQFSGQLGEFSNASSMLTYVDLSNNKLQGQIPRSIFKLSGLQRLHLDSNNFSGVVGSEFIKGLKDLGWLSLSNNKLTEIPLFIKYQNNSFRLELSKNKLTGAIPTFFCNLTNLELLDLSDNKLIGSIPP
ncbi:receptor like protein 30-like, partial [Phalaenopsis equestris]|uniref:receptor like protein 30-like n=1 Tax=Phalaenopsis equestris TaxID=78828 RepID=UPI0009E38FEF